MNFVGKWSLSALFHYKSKIKREPVKRHMVFNPYHAVSINPPLVGACAAAQRCAGKRFLSADAPTLPLAQCDMSTCQCRYRHHEDRRTDSRRIVDHGGISRVWNGSERRQSSGRRISDL